MCKGGAATRKRLLVKTTPQRVSQQPLIGLECKGGAATRKRLLVKTPPQRVSQQPLIGLELGDEADTKKARSVYLVTLPHPKRATSKDG